jgi:hypothetical protein
MDIRGGEKVIVRLRCGQRQRIAGYSTPAHCGMVGDSSAMALMWLMGVKSQCQIEMFGPSKKLKARRKILMDKYRPQKACDVVVLGHGHPE